MDIAALAIIKNQVQLQQDVGVAVLKKVINTAKENGNLITQLMEKSGDAVPQSKLGHLGNQIDLYV